MEDGMEAFLETIDSLRSAGCHVIGCGRNTREAREPAIIECKGNRIAILAYNSVGISESWVQDNKPGCVPLRVWTFTSLLRLLSPARQSVYTHFPIEKILLQ